MVRWLMVTLCAVLVAPAVPAFAQAPKPRFGITDNSFFVEEAFNQDAGVVQHIFLAARARDRSWAGSFTTEWPLGGPHHQLSLTLPFSVIGGTGGLGDILVNYRYQVWAEGDRRPAFSPRISAVIASSADRRALGAAGTGWQMNLPFSKQIHAFYLHGNAGATWVKLPASAAANSPEAWTNTPSAAASVIWGARPMLHPLLEVYAQSASRIGAPRENTVVIAPGFRTGWNVGERQIVVGLSTPVTRGDVRDRAVLLYFSLEMPFK